MRLCRRARGLHPMTCNSSPCSRSVWRDAEPIGSLLFSAQTAPSRACATKKDAKSDQKQHRDTIYPIENNGEPGGARTRDHRIKSAMLYQLSYRLEVWNFYCSARGSECANNPVNHVVGIAEFGLFRGDRIFFPQHHEIDLLFG